RQLQAPLWMGLDELEDQLGPFRRPGRGELLILRQGDGWCDFVHSGWHEVDDSGAVTVRERLLAGPARCKGILALVCTHVARGVPRHNRLFRLDAPQRTRLHYRGTIVFCASPTAEAPCSRVSPLAWACCCSWSASPRLPRRNRRRTASPC